MSVWLTEQFVTVGSVTLRFYCIEDFDDSQFHSNLFGGDQLTVARIRGVQALRDTQDKKVDRFEGLVPVIEDWHSRMTFMKVNLISNSKIRD